MNTAQRIHVKRLKRKRELEARVRCHGSVFRHKIAHKYAPKISFPKIVIPKFTHQEDRKKKNIWQRTKEWFRNRV